MFSLSDKEICSADQGSLIFQPSRGRLFLDTSPASPSQLNTKWIRHQISPFAFKLYISLARDHTALSTTSRVSEGLIGYNSKLLLNGFMIREDESNE